MSAGGSPRTIYTSRPIPCSKRTNYIRYFISSRLQRPFLNKIFLNDATRQGPYFGFCNCKSSWTVQQIRKHKFLTIHKISKMKITKQFGFYEARANSSVSMIYDDVTIYQITQTSIHLSFNVWIDDSLAKKNVSSNFYQFLLEYNIHNMSVENVNLATDMQEITWQSLNIDKKFILITKAGRYFIISSLKRLSKRHKILRVLKGSKFCVLRHAVEWYTCSVYRLYVYVKSCNL